jgi:hypothetical protein
MSIKLHPLKLPWDKTYTNPPKENYMNNHFQTSVKKKIIFPT